MINSRRAQALIWEIQSLKEADAAKNINGVMSLMNEVVRDAEALAREVLYEKQLRAHTFQIASKHFGHRRPLQRSRPCPLKHAEREIQRVLDRHKEERLAA